METFWLHTRDDMAEVNESMVCKFIPRQKKPIRQQAGAKPSLHMIPERNTSADVFDRVTAIHRPTSSISDDVQTYVLSNDASSLSNSLNNFLTTENKGESLKDSTPISNAEIEVIDICDDNGEFENVALREI